MSDELSWPELADQRFRDALYLLYRALLDGDQDAISLVGETFKRADRSPRRPKRKPAPRPERAARRRRDAANLAPELAELEASAVDLGLSLERTLTALRERAGQRRTDAGPDVR